MSQKQEERRSGSSDLVVEEVGQNIKTLSAQAVQRNENLNKKLNDTKKEANNAEKYTLEQAVFNSL